MMKTTRLGFDAATLWQQRTRDSVEAHPFSFIFESDAPISYTDLEWCCDRLVIEIGAPRASLNLIEPDAAEQLLLTRARIDIGAETFPNINRTAIDVAEAMISAARATRQRTLIPTRVELLHRAQLRSDFGAVSRSHPVNTALEVSRLLEVRKLIDIVSAQATIGGHLLVVGPPGQGKSWIAKQLLDVLSKEDWLIAEHYCYLGDADGERLERVLIENVFGSLIERLAEADPRLVQDQRPRFAADEETLVACLNRSCSLEPDRRVALIIDGIDHITRIRSRTGSSFDPSKSMSEALASLDLPSGTVIIILSQPGTHLDPLMETNASVIRLEGFSEHELRALSSRYGLVPSYDDAIAAYAQPLINDPDSIAAFLSALIQRSAGNALYATYLCRETIRSFNDFPNPADIILNLPPFDETLKSYYQHIYQSLEGKAAWVADVIALLDFPISRTELREIRPYAAHRIDDALKLLEPVLFERATQGGLRVYHESFARYLREPFQNDPTALSALLHEITRWLEQKGLFSDSRAFHSLLSLLTEAREDEQVTNLVDSNFVTKAVAASFPVSVINRNLAIAVRAATRLGHWPLVVRYVELSRAADSYQTERFDSTLVDFADVPAALLGADTLAERLIDEDRLVMPAREGLQMCAALDKLGATAPWQPYMNGHLRESRNDNTSYSEASNRAIALAWLRGRLRLTAANSSIKPEITTVAIVDGENSNNSNDHRLEEVNIYAPIDWSRLAQVVESQNLLIEDVINALLDTHGWQGTMHFISQLDHPSSAYLAIADKLITQTDLDPDMRSSQYWASMAVHHGIPRGALRRVLAHRVNLDELTDDTADCLREKLLNSTRQVQERTVQFEAEHVDDWLDACALAANRDPIGLACAEALITGVGWYRCWLRFVVALSRADAAKKADRGDLTLEALQILTADLDPFAGEPRSCDLYALHGKIAETLSYALGMLDDPQWSKGLRILKYVSDSITTTISGELGGPVPPDLVLHLAIDGASRNRRNVVEQLIKELLTTGSGRRYYSNLAEYRLLAARLALASDDRQGAAALWQEACLFLTAYGWHKDITIYEVLDPLPTLIQAAPALARSRVARVQALCERVPLHTDMRETRHAWERWWNLLAKADPVAAVHLAAPKLFCECNDPNWLLNQALEDVWREWYEHVDPIIAGTLRLTLDVPFDAADHRQLELIANLKNPIGKRLLIYLLARVDERPVSYSDTNSAELIARDDRQVEKLNEIAKAADVPYVFALRDEALSDADNSRSHENRRESPSKIMESDTNGIIAGFPPGMPGLAKAIRIWRNRPYDTHSAEWAPERFANIIGYRLIDLYTAGRLVEAKSALRSLADTSGLGERTSILRLLAEGLERNSAPQLAALAYALAWTRTRGHGGWLTFGGETEINSLQRANVLDAEVTNALVAEEIEQIVAYSRYGTNGISEALIYALATGALTNSNRSNITVAFDAWDEAFNVIASRAPRVDDTDDPETPYNPIDSDEGEPAPGDLEGAFALAAIAGLAHPGREKKRRTLLAVQMLLTEYPTVCARVFPLAINTISDPATLTWLLRVLELSAPQDSVLEAYQSVFRDLSTRNHLTVRALARRLIRGTPPSLAASEPPDKTLLGGLTFTLWTPDRSDLENDSDPPGLEELLSSVAGMRIGRAERMLERFYDAIRARTATTLKSEPLKNRLRRQLDEFGDRINKHWPNAFLASEQAIEEAIQSVAASGRAALLMAGELVLDPIQWEDDLASALLDDPTIPLKLEACRQPRPSLPPPPNIGDKVWGNALDQRFSGSGQNTEVTITQAGPLVKTLSLKPCTELPIMKNGPYRNWYWLGTYERRSIKPHYRFHEKNLIAERYRILEVRNINDRQALDLPPVTAGDLRLWGANIDLFPPRRPFNTSKPLLGIDTELSMIGDGRNGLGVPDSLLAPTVALIRLLRLQPGEPFIYENDSGAALALVTWRSEYDVSDYYLAWPSTCGCGIVIRPEVLTELAAIIGNERLVLRDFIVGDSQFADPNTNGSTDPENGIT